jgi:hypothetical protein
VAAIHAQKADSLPDVIEAYASADKAMPFTLDPAGKDDADRVKQAARERGNTLAASFLPTYRTEISKIPPSHVAAFRFARATAVLDKLTTLEPAFASYRDATKAAALASQASSCTIGAKRLGISGSQGDLPMVIGTEMKTLRDFACALADLGALHGTLDTPGLFSSSQDYVLTFFVPASGLAPRPINTLNLGGDPQQVAKAIKQAFDFRDLASPDPSIAPAPEVSQKLVLRRINVGSSGDPALVGLQASHGDKIEDLSIDQWRLTSGMMFRTALAPHRICPCATATMLTLSS